jgi:S-DNA-T family DNA segregation ATPase FtsK/SpoIIIE
MTSCATCGFDYDSLALSEIPATLRAFPGRFHALLAPVSDPAAARRPAPAVWSPLEYACHVRDVLLVQRDRTVRALVEEGPALPRMQRDERVALCHYSAQPVAQVLDQLGMAAVLLLLVFDDMAPAQWSRPLRYYGEADEERTVAWMARHTVHECLHHLGDIEAGLAALPSP